MKIFRRGAIAVSVMLALFAGAGTAFAQTEDPPILSALLVPAQLVVKVSILFNELLGFWVTGNYELSEPLGEKLIEGLSVIVPEFTNFFAQVLQIF